MAELLKREFGLVDLEVALDLSRPQPEVRCRLEGTVDGDRATFGEWRWDAAELGVPQRRSRQRRDDGELRLPAGFEDDLRALLSDVDPETPLWLHLARPAGLLPAMPWERLLQPIAERPVLRIPDFRIEPSWPRTDALQVAVLASCPAAKMQFDAVAEVAAVVESLLAADHGRSAEVHVFADADQQARLRKCAEKWGAAVRLHDPQTAAGFEEPESSSRVSSSSRIGNPWLLWILERLAGRAVDAFHFVGHGYLAMGRGSIALAPTPLSNFDSSWSRFVGAAELQQFATALGATSVSFTSVPGNFSEAGLRMVAHEIADRRPGPVLVHDSQADPERTGLSGGFGLVFAREPRPAPSSPALSLSCQPFRVLAGLPEEVEEEEDQDDQDDQEEQGPEQEDQEGEAEEAAEGRVRRRPQRRRRRRGPVRRPAATRERPPAAPAPTWSRSLARYLEEQRVELDRLRKSERSTAQRDAAALESTLSSISEVLAGAIAKKDG